MATINVKIFEDEKLKMLEVIKAHVGETIAVSALAAEAGFNPNRTRFIIDELLEEKRIKRTITKAFNTRYIRYKYEVL